MTTTTGVYFPNLTGLRFVAAAAAIIHHNEQLSGGSGSRMSGIHPRQLRSSASSGSVNIVMTLDRWLIEAGCIFPAVESSLLLAHRT